uniref:Uncharacterized protein n=1 Tax=Pipistrellus kuhlii TaxID=59472 RepID=A0A7J8A9Q8_PIPKU|nr:hypothetical protein mPipKuh1_009055 [Pipistrellus kuhlii]
MGGAVGLQVRECLANHGHCQSFPLFKLRIYRCGVCIPPGDTHTCRPSDPKRYHQLSPNSAHSKVRVSLHIHQGGNGVSEQMTAQRAHEHRPRKSEAALNAPRTAPGTGKWFPSLPLLAFASVFRSFCWRKPPARSLLVPRPGRGSGGLHPGSLSCWQ